MPDRRYSTHELVGADGWQTFFLSNLLIFASAGLSLLWQFRKVYLLARNTLPSAKQPLILVLGVRLRENCVTPDYSQRLDRALALLLENETREVFLLGGRTGDSTLSEAECGRAYLVARGAPSERIHIEDFSRHTLENLQQARMRLGDRTDSPCTLLTSRYHLARSHAVATGFGLAHRLCAAEDELQTSVAVLGNLLREAYFLHWYVVGWRWVHLTQNAGSLSRIS